MPTVFCFSSFCFSSFLRIGSGDSIRSYGRSTLSRLLASQRGLLFGNHFALWGHLRVQFDEAFPFAWNVVFVEDCFNRAFRNACLAVNALFWMDVKHLIAFVEALYGANHNTIGITATNTRLSYNVGHVSKPLLRYDYWGLVQLTLADRIILSDRQ